jgi:thymidylate synthase (FAD)
MHLNEDGSIVVDFKTSEECRCELVAHTMSVDKDGFLQLADYLPVSAARASFGREDKTGDDPKADLKLMKYLADHQHLTPFEYNHATFLVECPLFIRSQIMRHRTFAFNEISRRYTSEDIAFWVPDKWRAQSKSNKQASTDDEVRNEIWIDTDFGDGGTLLRTEPNDSYYEGVDSALWYYEQMIASGCSREQARAVFPQSLLTRFYMGGSLRNWVHFLKLRLDSHAQMEVQIVARKIESQLRELWPEAMGVLLPIEESN